MWAVLTLYTKAIWILGCDYDGGDCCGQNVRTKYCNECQCKACGAEQWYKIQSSKLEYWVQSRP